MGSTTYYEKCNEERLLKVLNSSNVFKNGNDDDKEWNKDAKIILTNYSNIYLNKNGRRIIYHQKGEGRFNVKYGIQRFKKCIRSYILTGDDGIPLYTDIDMVNCHPVILEYLFKKNNLGIPKFLDLYNRKRDIVLKRIKLYNIG